MMVGIDTKKTPFGQNDGRVGDRGVTNRGGAFQEDGCPDTLCEGEIGVGCCYVGCL